MDEATLLAEIEADAVAFALELKAARPDQDKADDARRKAEKASRKADRARMAAWTSRR